MRVLPCLALPQLFSVGRDNGFSLLWSCITASLLTLSSCWPCFLSRVCKCGHMTADSEAGIFKS